MPIPTKVTVNIREATTILISDRGVHRSGEPAVIEFEGSEWRSAITKAIIWLEKVECPREKLEWALIRWAMCNWLRHKCDPRDPFKNKFSYASGRLWMITLTIEEIPCKPQQPTPHQPQPLSQRMNTKSWWLPVQRVLKKLFNNI